MKNKALIKAGFIGEKMTVIPRGLLKDYSNSTINRDLYLTDIGYFPKALHHFRKRPKGCSEHILIYCIEGYGSVGIERVEFQLKPNSFLIIEADKAHYYYSDKENPWSIFWIHFSGNHSQEIYRRFAGQNYGKPIIIPFEKNRIAEFEYLIDIFKNGLSKEVFEYSSMLLYKTLGSFIHYSLKSSKKIESNHDQLISNIITYLNEHIYETVKIEDISKAFNKSPSSIFTLFKQKTGHSLIHHFNLLKIQKACELINLTSLSIKEISFQLDFQDPLYFSRLFKKYMGVPPSKYKSNL
ncbi:helix-turn-helix domain-containing protein [Echinicola shivajiensis]|uniref:helix-turn-helix domain-containing protein n=1 Tax=Echinicola shivajiensis TaxID=1035916 RepID=UPI001BFC4EB4|nr:helix-turn-helix domain-containing protein [Echinicola shivajiensis]